MEIKIELRTLIKMKGVSVKEYCKALGMSEITMRMRFKEPKKMTIEKCHQSDKVLDLPIGTTYAVINGNVMFNDIIEYINK